MSTAADIRTALRARYQPPAWALLFEVGDETGAGKRRSADAIAMSLWPSRGLNIDGIEIKVSRSDYLRELKTPQKAESIAMHCNSWWIATPPGVVKDDLPAGWGHLELVGRRLVVRVPATIRTDTDKLDRKFVAAILRAHSGAVRADFESELKVFKDSLRETVEAEIKGRIYREIGERSTRQSLLDVLEKELGQDSLTHLNQDEFVKAVALVLKSGAMHTWLGLESIRDSLLRMAHSIEDAHLSLGIPITNPTPRAIGKRSNTARKREP